MVSRWYGLGVLGCLPLLAGSAMGPIAPAVAQPEAAVRPVLVPQFGSVGALARTEVSPDGKVVLGLSRDGSLRVWSADTWELRHVYREMWEADPVVVFSPDARWVLVTGVTADRMTTMWMLDARSGETLRRWKVGEVPRSPRFSGDGERLYFLTSAGIHVWAWRQEEPSLWQAASIDAGSLALSPDGRTLVFSGIGSLDVLDLETGRRARKITAGFDQLPPDGLFVNLTYSPDGKLLAGSSSDIQRILAGEGSVVAIWNLETGTLVRRFQAEASVDDLRFSPGGDLLFTSEREFFPRERPAAAPDPKEADAVPPPRLAAGDGELEEAEFGLAKIKAWDVETGTLRKQLTSAEAGTALQLLPDGKTLITFGELVDNPAPVHRWNLETGEPGEPSWPVLPVPDGQVTALRFSPDGKYLAVGGGDTNPFELAPGFLSLWEIQTGKLLRTGALGFGSVRALEFSANSRLLAFGGDSGRILVNEIPSGEFRLAVEELQWPVWTLRFSPDGKLLAGGTGDPLNQTGSLAFLWSTSNGKRVAKLQGHVGAVTELAFSPDGKRLATGSQDHMIKLWDVAGHKLLKTLTNAGDGPQHVRFSADGRRVTALAPRISNEQELAVFKTWDAQTGRRRQVRAWLRNESDDFLKDSVVSPDGQLAATAMQSRTVWLVETESGTILRKLPAAATALAFSPDGKRLATGTEDHGVQVWDVATGRLLTTLQLLPWDPEAEEDGWLAYTPEGHYAGTPDAEQYFRWRVGGELYPGARYRAEFRRPDKIRAALTGTP